MNLSGIIFIATFVGSVLLGAILMVFGIGRNPRLCPPLCVACGYDVRNDTNTRPAACTECGAELAKPGTISMAEVRRSNRWVVAGFIVLVLGPILGWGAAIMTMVARNRTVAVANAGASTMMQRGFSGMTSVELIAAAPSVGDDLSSFVTAIDDLWQRGAMTGADAASALGTALLSEGLPRETYSTEELIKRLRTGTGADPATPDALTRLSILNTVSVSPRLVLGALHHLRAGPFGSRERAGLSLESVTLESGRPVTVGRLQVDGRNHSGFSNEFRGVTLRATEPPFPLDRTNRGGIGLTVGGDAITSPEADVLIVSIRPSPDAEPIALRLPVEVRPAGSDPFDPSPVASGRKAVREFFEPMMVSGVYLESEGTASVSIALSEKTTLTLPEFSMRVVFEVGDAIKPVAWMSARPGARSSSGRPSADNIPVADASSLPSTVTLRIIPDYESSVIHGRSPKTMFAEEIVYENLEIEWR